MKEAPLRLVFLGLTVTSSWGNRHATTYRALIRALGAMGHEVLFLERDVPWYQEHRDCLQPDGGRVARYASLAALKDRWTQAIRQADAVILGSYVPDGQQVARFVQQNAQGIVAFYDLDTPITLARLSRGDNIYLSPKLIPGFHLYLSCTGGPILERLELQYGAQQAAALYGSVDPERYRPSDLSLTWDLGYLGTYRGDRQPALRELLLDVAKLQPQSSFAIYGTGYPGVHTWPENVAHHPHLPPADHPAFYNRQRFTLNLTRAERIAAGFSPSVRLFEAAACGTPIITDPWPGLQTQFRPGEEILIAEDAKDILRYLNELPEEERRAIGERGRARVLARHTHHHRARELTDLLRAASGERLPMASSA